MARAAFRIRGKRICEKTAGESVNDAYLSVPSVSVLSDIRGDSIKPTPLLAAELHQASGLHSPALKRAARVTVCVIIVKLNEPTSVAFRTRSCFLRMRRDPREVRGEKEEEEEEEG